MLRRRLPIAFALLFAACGKDSTGPALDAGTYAIVGSPSGATLPLVVRAITEAEIVLSGGRLTLPSIPSEGGAAAFGELVVHVSSGPLGGPYIAAESLTLFFTPEREDNRLILRYPTEGPAEPLAPDTLSIHAGGELRGAIPVPGAVTGRADVVFRLLDQS